MRFTATVAVLLAATACLLAHDPITTKVTWDREIVSLFEARCVSCHTPGGRAPMSLATYEEARPWARAIREEVLARRMPKWPVVRGYGDFRNDPSLSAFEVALITAWVDGGAPKTLPNRIRGVMSSAPAGGASARPDAAADRGKAFTIGCTSQALPAGRLVSITPTLRPGGSLRLILHYGDGRAEPLIWLRNFDPAFAETYDLRVPVTLPGGARVSAEPLPREGCQVSFSVLP